jgi:sugar transferase (PEP-CTERM/EpsH1 system associated)
MAEYLFHSPYFASRFSAQLQQPTCNSQPNKPKKRATRNSEVGTPKLIMDFCDLDSDKWLQYSQRCSFPASLVCRIESKLLLKYEKQINQLFDHSVFVTEQEASLFSKLYPEAKNVSVISNGVDYNYFSPKQSTLVTQSLMQDPQLATCKSQPILLFTGAMDYYANVDAVTWFHNETFPMIKREFPESQFFIVGDKPHYKVKDLASNDAVQVTGFIEDVRPYYKAADVCVIPLRLARGIQNKVLEAMAMGKAVVATTKAVEGIQGIPEEHVLVADSSHDFTKAVSRLLNDMALRKQLGERARQFVIENYTWPTHMQKLEALLH